MIMSKSTSIKLGSHFESYVIVQPYVCNFDLG